MSGHYCLLLCLLSLLCEVPLAWCAGIEADLIKGLLADYDVSARPVTNISTPITVKVGLMLQQIIRLEERSQELEIKVWQRYEWQDDFLTWNPAEHGGLKKIRIVPNRIWRPDMTIYNDLNNDPNMNAADVFPSTVTHTGTVFWYSPKVITTSCNVEIYNYPWDEQKCTLKVGSWTYDGSALDVTNKSTAGDLSYYATSGEWSILSFSVKQNVVWYHCCPNPFPDVTFTLHIRRKVGYFVSYLIQPTIFITFTAVLVFHLPPESGERVSLSVTVLLALIVFLLLIAESVPRTNIVPLIGRYFQSIILLMSLSTCLTVVTLNVHHRGVFGNEVPAWMKTLVLNWMARVLCMKKMVDGKVSSPPATKNLAGTNENGTGNVEVISVSTSRTQEMNGMAVRNHNAQSTDAVSMATEAGQQAGTGQDACSRDWKLVSAVINRLLLITFFIVAVALTMNFISTDRYSDVQPIA